MEDTQSITDTEKSHKQLKKGMKKRSKRFIKELKNLESPDDACGIRMTAIPIKGAIKFDRVFQQGNIIGGLDIPPVAVIRKAGNETSHLSFPEKFRPPIWRPILRGARAQSDKVPSRTTFISSYREIHCDGFAEWGCAFDHSNPPEKMETQPLFHDWVIAMFANMVAWSEQIRAQNPSPVEEYAIEVEICVFGSTVDVLLEQFSSLGILAPGSIKFPRYFLKSPDDVPTLLSQFYRDFWNCLGKDFDNEKLEIQNGMG